MNKYVLFLLCLSSCVSRTLNYPLKKLDLSNFRDKNVDFKYKKIKDIEYEFCSGCIYKSCSGDNSGNLIERSIEKFLLENELKTNQYLINFSYSYKSRFYIIAFSSCTKVTMELVEKVDE